MQLLVRGEKLDGKTIRSQDVCGDLRLQICHKKRLESDMFVLLDFG